ncbi:class I SAM-dependent methyltransferase [Larkinella rosea]|uniref:SAM-dependent methyltransferase n=1 Tax=Larkinella rosea TaxID=2025312 RepID=A0A3P1BNW2_9BACT|nr:class I SAM-dependent methyltransferase [Larkinella rosea]RRB02762.1 SAM-dependent methyltransferase [Larkinella rosea]
MIFLSNRERVFIQDHLQDDPHALLLRHSESNDLRLKVVAAQLIARQKARTKLPGWYANAELVFPAALSVEQASSERTAAYKASIVAKNPEPVSLLIDLTGGMGVDSLAFSNTADRVIYVEQQTQLAELAAYNLPKLGGKNIDFYPSTDAHQFLSGFSGQADWIYLDPARRDQQGGKVVRLEDCEPNVLDWYQSNDRSGFRKKSVSVLVKTSPMIDIETVIQQVPDVVAVHVVSVDNECKEVLFVLRAQSEPTIEVTAVNLRSSGRDEAFFYRRNEEKTAHVPFSDPLRYLYEPNASILKAGAFRSVAEQLGLHKIAPNSHLYTSEEWLPDFPGRSFEMLGSCKPDRKEIHFFCPEKKANLSVRNFPESAETLRKKLSLASGGDLYLFATTLLDNKKRILITRKPIHPSLLQ